ncbi:Antitoxin component YwqK of the YwqJK toxin-antitoxin module [Saccharicrinis carchari]|uniref:Antitoxin component YwqK of the YwqJK toxin-antitoxin module n=1 Tax=Saccharicrinis carchari TaxID=1168039 RepID=A0A521DCY9_SACCC|nr:toxin-antitoxin system YwqK family antitoxin [Saccharicrinis carchari]SMO69475.1 Antitoxin component YwqK of the YwqJK toxin-antitoxin module [Saccharicrinis carchari]
MRILFSAFLLFACFVYPANAQITDVFGNKVPIQQGANTKGVSSNFNQKDEQGRKQGYWEKRYSNGKPAYTVTFVDDKPVGTMMRYYFNGNKKVKIVYDENQYGAAELYSEDGKLTAKGFYDGTHKDSVWQYFSPQGILYTTESYKDSLKNGLTTYYYKDGSVAEEIEWKDDNKEGIWRKYHENGRLKMTSAHKNDHIEGEYILYYPNGKLELQGFFSDGLENGTWVVFTPGGTVAYKIEYKDGITLNADEFDEKQRKMFEEFDKNKGKIKDPEQFRHDPDQYMRGGF